MAEYMLIWGNFVLCDIPVLRPHPWLVGGVWSLPHTRGRGMLGPSLLPGSWRWAVDAKMPEPYFHDRFPGGCPVPVHNPRPWGAWGFQDSFGTAPLASSQETEASL